MAELMMAHDASFATYIAQLGRDPLHCARKASQQEQRIVGYVGADIPVELIFAANALPLRLRAVPNRATPHADTYLESSFHPEVRAIAEQWLRGDLHFVDAVVFPRSDDSAQRLYYYLCELQRAKRCGGPTPLLFDVSTIARATSREYTLDSLRRLADVLRTDTAALKVAIERTNQRVQLLGELNTLRTQERPPLGSESYAVRHAAELDWTINFDSALGSWLSTASRQRDRKRIVLAGSAPPDICIHIAVESVGGIIVREVTESQDFAQLSTIDPFATIAQRHHMRLTPAQEMLRSANYLVDQAHSAHADGVILWAIDEDEALPWEVARQTAALKSAEIPVLTLTRQRWHADTDTLDCIAEFARTLERRR
jgi:benzoyl-CoA reductase/2-hydroxyglutaryl-CoA dehydratase subunit BcrC/BadD/HgdB